jgi:hypothetical protein
MADLSIGHIQTFVPKKFEWNLNRGQVEANDLH